MTVPKSEWVWYGYAGHLCVGRRCAYHMATRIGGFLVSTVGHFLPDGKTMEHIGGPDDFFETFVFRCDGETADGDPNLTSLEEVFTRRYAKSIDAERGHRQICDEFADKKPEDFPNGS